MSRGRDKPRTGSLFRRAAGDELDRSAIPHGSVALDWTYNPPGEMAAWASCFHSAAETLVRDISTRETYEGREACPIAFLYRHALELYLKALLVEAATLMQAEGGRPIFSEQLLSKHDLKPLVAPLEETFCRFKHSWSLAEGISCSYEDVLDLVEELDRLDSGSYAFRYPVTKSFNSPSLPHHLRFDVFELSKRAGGALAGLEALVKRVNFKLCMILADDEEDETQE